MITCAPASPSSMGSSASVDTEEQILDQKVKRVGCDVILGMLTALAGVGAYLAIQTIGFHLWMVLPFIGLALCFSVNHLPYFLAKIPTATTQPIEVATPKLRHTDWRDHPEAIRLFKEREKLQDGPQLDLVNSKLLHLKNQLQSKVQKNQKGITQPSSTEEDSEMEDVSSQLEAETAQKRLETPPPSTEEDSVNLEDPPRYSLSSEYDDLLVENAR